MAPSEDERSTPVPTTNPDPTVTTSPGHTNPHEVPQAPVSITPTPMPLA